MLLAMTLQNPSIKKVNWLVLRILSFLHQSFHFTHFLLAKSMHANLSTLSVKSDGGETNNRSVDHNARNRLVGNEVGVVVQQRRRLDSNALPTKDNRWREQHIGFRNAGGSEFMIHDRNLFIGKHRLPYQLLFSPTLFWIFGFLR